MENFIRNNRSCDKNLRSLIGKIEQEMEINFKTGLRGKILNYRQKIIK